MKIANWNIERLKNSSKIDDITQNLTDLDADILVLTETDNRIFLENYEDSVSTNLLTEIEPKNYKETENRVTIYSKYKILRQFETFDKYTSLCVELKTEFGNLVIYGTIIGIYGNRNENFTTDLTKQILDFDKYAKDENFCVVGDYNISFSDNYYFTNYGRKELDNTFDKNKLTLLTRKQKECIDHIAISTNFVKNLKTEIHEWNFDKKMSDHKGIFVNLTKE
jgi:exonuclease III